MNERKLGTVTQLRVFLDGTEEVELEAFGEDSERYASITEVVRRLRYGRLKRPDKGVVMRYLERTTGYSRQQLTRLVGRAVRGERLKKRYRASKQGFRRKFTDGDVKPLAELDALHGTLLGAGDQMPARACLQAVRGSSL